MNTLQKISTINGKEANGFDLLMLWQSITKGREKIVFAKKGKTFVNFITEKTNKQAIR